MKCLAFLFCVFIATVSLAGPLDADGLKVVVMDVGEGGAVHPWVAAIFVDLNNIRGYPSPRVVERLRRTASALYLTSEYGDISLILQEESRRPYPCLGVGGPEAARP